jgi:cytochrome P450 family 135
MSLILAGHETTASQLAWAFQLLAHNPAAQQRLIDEIDRDAGDEYLTATIDEVLRHRPVFLFAIPRAVKRPIEIGGFTYEPPTQLLACIYLLHHDPRVYPEPERFQPERFLEGQPSPRLWMPWGGGRKRCPGSQMALLEMKTVLRTVLARAVVRPASPRIERPRWRSVIVTPHAGGRVVLRPRHSRGSARSLGDVRPDSQSSQKAMLKNRI